MLESESSALPFGDSPIYSVLRLCPNHELYYNSYEIKMQVFFLKFLKICNSSLLFIQPLAFTAKSVRKRSITKPKSICKANLRWILACYWNGVNSNNSSAINVKSTSYSVEMLSPDLRETFVLNEVFHEFSTTTSRPERERVRLIFQPAQTFLHKLFQQISAPAGISRSGVSSASSPFSFSAQRIIPSDKIPANLAGFKFTSTITFLPTISSAV